MAERLSIERVGQQGDGIAATAEGNVFIAFGLPGESVEVELEAGRPDRRRIVSINTASADRIAPICPHFTVCGGCAVQHWAEPQYRQWKRSLVDEALAHAGIAASVDDLIDAHGAGRRRAVLHARRSGNGLAVGFAGRRAHHIVAIDRCPILAPAMHGALAAARAVAEALAPADKPLDIHATATNQGLDIDVRGSGPLAPAHSAALASIAARHRLARITRHGETIVQVTAPTVTIGRAQVPLPPGAFLQPTEAGEAALANLVIEAVGNARVVADLFCGIGTCALRLAERARVIAADSDAAAIAALRRGASSASGLKPIDAERRDLFRRPLLAEELARVDAVVFDPPRQGALAQARMLAASKVPMVVTVSCNPQTFARDVRILLDGGYRLTRVTPMDQFRYSPHVEIVARLVR